MHRPRARDARLLGTDRHAHPGAVEQSSQVQERATVSAANVQDAFAPAQIQPLGAVIQQADLGSLRLILRIDEQPMMDVVAQKVW